MLQKYQRGRVRRGMPRPLRNALISAFVLLVLIVGCGAAYTWYMDEHTVLHPATVAANSDSIPAFAKPVAPAANARVGASVETLTSPVAPGDNASVTVQTLADAKCKISVVYKDVASTDSGLITKTADEYGTVMWTWTVGNTVPPGTWPVNVTCTRNGTSGYVRGDLQVVKADVQS